MINKLAFRNMKRSARDYLVYIFTMTLVTALMYSFNSLFFQNDLGAYFSLEEADIMAVMIGLCTVFIVLIVAWLIGYMVRFMLEKRSTEFGIYLLLGMKKKTVSRLYIRENILLGCASFLLGCLVGVLLRQFLLTIMFSMVRMEYRLHFSLSRETVLTTLCCYGGCYLLALLRCRRKFKKMNIQALMNAKRQNEEIRERHEGVKQLILPLSVLFIFLFWAAFGMLRGAGEILLFLIGLVLTIYLFYTGLSAWIICYVRRKGNGIYRGQNLFLLRQFASKIRTMQFTLGTLTSLFTLALMGASIALMFSTYENTVLEDKYPFDIQIYNENADYDFEEERAVIDSLGTNAEYYTYRIYTDGEIQANIWILTHLRTWGDQYRREDGTPDLSEIQNTLWHHSAYYVYDTYMGLSDYNRLRSVLGYTPIPLTDGEYLVQTKPRLYEEMLDIGQSLRIGDKDGQRLLTCAGIVSDPFSQDGHNGADYLVVVPDAVLERMEPYYSELVADVQGDIPMELQRMLDDLEEEEDLPGSLQEYLLEQAEPRPAADFSIGSDEIVSYAGIYLVKNALISQVKYVLSSLIFPLFYMGLVFVCVAMTVLSVQQLSDSAKYRFRYDVLSKLGLNQRQLRSLILRQMAAYYLCPAILAMVISGKMILAVSNGFVDMTGVPTAPGGFFLKSIALFFGIYLVYFAMTYVSFRRNVEEKQL